MNNKLLSILVVIAIVLGGFGSIKQAKVVTTPPPQGALSGPNIYEGLTAWGGLSRALINPTSTSLTSLTLVSTDLVSGNNKFYETILFTKTGSVASTTWTFPASSTVAALPNPGERTNVCFFNATSTGGAALVIAEGTGWDFVVASSTRVQISSGLAPSSAVSRTAMGRQPLCGEVIRQKINDDSTSPGDLTVILNPTYPAQ